jgi:hypothetical protein
MEHTSKRNLPAEVSEDVKSKIWQKIREFYADDYIASQVFKAFLNSVEDGEPSMIKDGPHLSHFIGDDLKMHQQPIILIHGRR